MDGLFPAKKLLRYVLSMFSPSAGRRISSEICGGCAEKSGCAESGSGIHPLREMLRSLYEGYGLCGLLKGDAILFGWALVITVLSDIFLGSVPALQNGLGAAVCFFMAHIMDDDAPAALLITAYIVLNCARGGLWGVAALFIMLFEHLGLKGASR